MKSILLRVLLLLIVCVPTLSLAQDKIILTSGRKFNCKILSETGDSINIILHGIKGDRNTAIERKYIQSIIYESGTDKIILTNSQEIICNIESEDDQRITYKTNSQDGDKTSSVEKSIVKEILYGKEAKNGENSLRRFNVSVNIGYNFPLGDFGNHDMSNTSGYAKESVSFDISLSYRISEYWGIGVKGFKTSNSVDSVSLLDLLGSSKLPWTLRATNWETKGALGGLVLFVPDQISFQLRALAGYMSVNSPEMRFTAEDNWIYQKSVSSSALGYDLGLGLEVPVFKNANLLVNIDYLFSKFKLQNIDIQSFGETKHNYFIGEKGYQKFSLLNFSLGFGYKF